MVLSHAQVTKCVICSSWYFSTLRKAGWGVIQPWLLPLHTWSSFRLAKEIWSCLCFAWNELIPLRFWLVSFRGPGSHPLFLLMTVIIYLVPSVEGVDMEAGESWNCITTLQRNVLCRGLSSAEGYFSSFRNAFPCVSKISNYKIWASRCTVPFPSAFLSSVPHPWGPLSGFPCSHSLLAEVCIRLSSNHSCRYLSFLVPTSLPPDSSDRLGPICTSWDCQLLETGLMQARIIPMATK